MNIFIELTHPSVPGCKQALQCHHMVSIEGTVPTVPTHTTTHRYYRVVSVCKIVLPGKLTIWPPLLNTLLARHLHLIQQLD